ncbi:MAG TPA: hypothetical protein PKW38_06815 [Paludibacteraceae bacterium]|nr:hypothetical protein [Paludibacteraceae bacterium]
MTAQDYIAKGYKLSANTSSKEIDRAVAEVTRCYVDPFGIETESDVVTAAIVHLSFIFMLQRRDFVTRTGGVEKTQSYGQKVEVSNSDYRIAASFIYALAEISPIEGDVAIDDICGIYKQSLINL